MNRGGGGVVVRRASLVAASAALLGACAGLGGSKPVQTGFVARSYKSELKGATRQYGLYVPPEYNRTRRKFPLILFLHGAGERGDDVELVKKHGPIKVALEREEFPFVVVAPQCPAPEAGEGRLSVTWTQAEADVLKVLDEVMRDYRVDPTRVYLTGLSLGGFGSFHLAAKYPARWAAVAPICGGGDPAQADAYRSTPFWVFHGLKDTVVPPSRSREMVESMRAMGNPSVKFTTYPEAGHDSWTQTYASDELYIWFLAQRLPRK
jgi:predicted peptidase